MSAPATTYVLELVDDVIVGPLRGVHARHALLALASLADADLNGPNGLDVVSPARVARVVGLATSTVDRTLRVLAASGTGVVAIIAYAGVRHSHTDGALPRGARLLGYRFTEEVYG